MLGNFSHDNIIQYLFTTVLLYPNKTFTDNRNHYNFHKFDWCFICFIFD